MARFLKKVMENKMCIYNFCMKHFSVLEVWARYDQKCILAFT